MEGNAIVAHYEYDAFGNEIASKTTGSKSDDFAHKFSTKYQDTETDYYYYGYRYYDPVTGRWPSREPIFEPGGFNLYVNAHNNRLNFYDYFGLVAKKACEFNIKVGHGWFTGWPGAVNRTTKSIFDKQGCGDGVAQVSCFAGDVNDSLREENENGVIDWDEGYKRDPDIPLTTGGNIDDPENPGGSEWNREQPGFLPGSEAIKNLISAIKAAEQQAPQDCRDKETCCKTITIDVLCLSGGRPDFSKYKNKVEGGIKACNYKNTYNCKKKKWSGKLYSQ